MGGYFFNLGRNVRATLRKGKWVVQSLTGNEADAIEAEFEAGRDLAFALLQQMEADADPAVTRLLADLGNRLASRVRDPRRRFCVAPLLVREINAFALPGGFLFVTRPLLELCGWDGDEIAFVLAHEMAHVLRGHAMERMMNGWMLNAAGRLMPVRGLAGAWLMERTGALVHSSYARDQELDADALGLRLACAAGFERHAALRLLSRLPPAAAESGIESYFATHPPLADRLANLQQLL